MQGKSSTPLIRFPWDDVQLFLVLSRSRTMGEAAETLGVNTSTVSRRLAALEEALDATLFDRGREGLAPTSAAEALLAAAEQTEAAVAAFANEVDGLERDVAGEVRLACPPDMAEVVVLPVLRELLAEHPRLRVLLSPGEATLDLQRREADIALRTVRPTRGDLVARLALRVTWVTACSPALAQSLGRLRAPESVPWIGWGPGGSRLPASQWLERHAPEPVLRTESLTHQLAAARAGIGVALVPAPSVAHYGLTALRFADPDSEAAQRCPQDDVFLVTHRSLRRVPRIKVVWEALLASLQDRFGGEGGG